MQAPNNQPYDVPAYLHGDGSFEGYTPYGAPMQAQQLPEKKMVSVDVGEFVRTRDAVSSSRQRRDFATRCITVQMRRMHANIDNIAVVRVHEPVVVD